MFLDELSPLFREFTGHPVAFMGGFVSGLFKLNLAEDPVRSWLQNQSGSSSSGSGASTSSNGNRPQSITID
jgi:hypothetical protein